MYRGKVSIRKVHACIQRLLMMPGRSALLASYDESTLWGTSEHLIARLGDQLAEAVWLWASAHSEDEIPRPEPIPRPGEDQEETDEAPKEFASTQQVAQVFESISVGGFL